MKKKAKGIAADITAGLIGDKKAATVVIKAKLRSFRLDSDRYGWLEEEATRLRKKTGNKEDRTSVLRMLIDKERGL